MLLALSTCYRALAPSKSFRKLCSGQIRPKVATVIGGSGFVGSWVVKNLVEKGYRVRATSRERLTAGWLKRFAINNTGDVELFELQLSDEMPDDVIMDKVIQGSDKVFFCAGFERQDPSTIEFMVKNAVATVRAAKRNNVSVVVLTSSGGSTNPPDLEPGTPKNEIKHWSDAEKQRQQSRFSPAAKTWMELYALGEVGRDQENEVYDQELASGAPRICIMNPNLILGPQMRPGLITGNSLPWIVRILNGEKLNEIIPNDSMSIIDVRDLAEMHVAAAENPEASGRYFAVTKSYPWVEILNAFKEAHPPYRVPKLFKGEQALPTQFDFTRRDSLGVNFRPLQETIRDTVTCLKNKDVIKVDDPPAAK